MSGTRIAFEGTYTSGTVPQQYRYTVVSDMSGVLSVRNILSPYGLIIDSMTRLPQSVVSDITTSISQVETLLTMTSAVNGTLTFVAEAEQTVTFSTPMTDTNYRVYFNPSDFLVARVSAKSTTSFTCQLNISFTGTVGYDVVV